MLTPTPTGTYSIINKHPNPGGAFGVMWMGLSKLSYGIHGTNDPSSIGHVVSHGCIRMYNRDVLALSKVVPIGTQVTIVNYGTVIVLHHNTVEFIALIERQKEHKENACQDMYHTG